MRAAILLKANPGCQDKINNAIRSFFAENDPVQGVEIETIARYHGSWDAIVTLKCIDLESLTALIEMLRKDGTFHTETLISIE